MHRTSKRPAAGAIIALASLVPPSPFIATHRRMAEFRTSVSPGMSVAELHSFAGTPERMPFPLLLRGACEEGRVVFTEAYEHSAEFSC
jgi:hypothetical protein